MDDPAQSFGKIWLEIATVSLCMVLMACSGSESQGTAGAVLESPQGAAITTDDSDSGEQALPPFEKIHKEFLGPVTASLPHFAVEAIADVNGDGIEDIASLSREGLRVIDPTIGAVDDTAIDIEDATIWYLDNQVPNLQGNTLRCETSGATAASRKLASVGDVNGDGVADIAVTNPMPQGPFPEGTLCVVSGVDGASLLFKGGPLNSVSFGTAIASIGDVTGDRKDDFAMGAQYHDTVTGNNAGGFYIVSGANGEVLREVYGENANDYLGYRIAVAGDLNDDTITDIVVSARGYDGVGGQNSGAIYAINIQGMLDLTAPAEVTNPSVLLFKIDRGDEKDGALGAALDAGHDLTGDSIPDIIAGAPGNANIEGSVKGFSGVDGSELFHWQQSGDSDTVNCTSQSAYGRHLKFVGDMNHDGISEIIVGDPNFNLGANLCAAGKVYVNRYNGVGNAPSPIFDMTIQDQWANLGKAISAIADINQDLRAEVIIGYSKIGGRLIVRNY